MLKRKILIIGGCGYIGASLYNYLKQSYDVDTLDIEWFGNYNNGDNLKGDFRFFQDFHKYTDVVLLAGHSSVKMSLGNDGSCFRNNVANFVSLVDKLSPDQKLIYASSSSVYSQNGHPINHYDNSKLIIDNHSLLMRDKMLFGLRFGTVNGWSPNFRNEIMINSMVYSHRINGKISISNPGISRPILWLSNLNRMIKSIILNGTHKNKGIFNLASFNATVEEIGLTVSEILNCPLELKRDRGPKPYDFSMEWSAICDEFGTNTNCGISDIVNDLVDNYDKIRNFDNRNQIIKYD